MRLELAGSVIHAEPVVLTFTEDAEFDTLQYTEFGFTHFDVICIGGGGGNGGGIDTANTGSLIRSYGGRGGGGGFHRVRGLLSALPPTCPVVVGVGGAEGYTDASNVGAVTDGGDGGYSSFNTNTCRASGGEGGQGVESNSSTIGTVANGGAGGVGASTFVGGGAAGGVAGTPTDTGPGTPGTDGLDGVLDGDIGEGGGGGAGGVGKYGSGGVTCNAATIGGRGAYNPGDTSVFAPGEDISDDPSSGSDDIVPGRAGGAKAAPLNGLPYVYGGSGQDGIVVIRLSRE
jgi:hypothetical protein